MTLYFEDFAPGQTYDLGLVAIDEREMVGFARRFDPQPFHTDPELAKQTSFGELIASGWYTGSLFMRMYVDSVLHDSSSQGSPGLTELRWLAPVRAGDVLTGTLYVLRVQDSSTRPDRGTVFMRGELYRGDTTVVRMEFRGLFGRRHPLPG